MVPLQPGARRAEVAQHPAGEVHATTGETRHVAALGLGAVPVEAGQRLGRPSLDGQRVTGEEQRVQESRGVVGVAPGSGQRTQQVDRLPGAAAMGVYDAEPRRRFQPLVAGGRPHRLGQPVARRVEISARVQDPARRDQAAGAGLGVGGGEGAVVGVPERVVEPPVEVRGPRADLPASRARVGCGRDIVLGIAVATAPDPHLRPRDQGVVVRDQRKRLVEQVFRGGVVEALGRPGGRDPQPGGRQRLVAAQPRVVGDDGRVGVRPAGQHPPGLAVQQRAPARGGAGDERLADQLMAEPVPPGVLGQESTLLRELDVGEHVQRAPVQHGGEHLHVEVVEDRGGAHQLARAAELVAPRRHRCDERGWQLAGRHRRQLGEEERMAA